MAGAKLGDQLREHYLAAILVQDQAFFDRIGPGEIVTRAGKDINLIRVGLGEKLGYLTWSLAIILAVRAANLPYVDILSRPHPWPWRLKILRSYAPPHHL